MSAEVDLTTLVNRVATLKEQYLPRKQPEGKYSEAEHDGTAAFLLLVHAEIEWFIERRCLAVVDLAVSEWKLDVIPRSTILGLAAFAHKGGLTGIPKTIGAQKPALHNVIIGAKRNYSDVVDNNNGVKEEDLLKLLLPIGIKEAQLDSSFLEKMTELGTWRGNQAHKGVGARKPPDPGDVEKSVDSIVNGLRVLDGELDRLNTEHT